jgi:nanoRNase/pAp phosphatase (c-di-AMP/oligoRNAs hydrolase)
VIALQDPGFIEYLGEKIIVLGHHNADPDAVGAAQGVRELIETLKPNTIVEIVMPEGISNLSMNLITKLGLENVKSQASYSKYDTIIIVDSGGLSQIGEWETKIKNHEGVSILIDHHTQNDYVLKIFDLIIHDENASSTCELVYQIYTKYNIKPTIKTKKALIAGIIFDTKYLSLGNAPTFRIISNLLEGIGNISNIRSLLKMEANLSERIARLKTAQRTEIHKINDWIIIISEIGSYQSSGARALISLGADLAIVIGIDNEKIRASLRSTQLFYSKTGIHLGKLVSEINGELEGYGSGHPTASGYNGIGTKTEFKETILKILRIKIEKKSITS